MKNKITRFLTVSLAVLSVFCVLIFSLQTICMNLLGADTIKQLGVIYMSGLSEQVTTHFGTAIELRLSQVGALTDVVPPERELDESFTRVELTHSARSRGFEYLAYYTKDGNFHMIFGPQVEAEVPETLHNSIIDGKMHVSSGTDIYGTRIVLMGVPAAYKMEGGGTSIAIVGGLPVSYLNDTLAVNVDGMGIDYSIIREDGSFIFQSNGAQDKNYFEKIKELGTSMGLKNSTGHIQDIKAAMESGQDYVDEFIISKARGKLYCTKLPDSEWYLLLYMSYNTLDGTVDNLARRWSIISLGGCSLILCAFLLVFIGYFRLTRRQVRELDEARQAADKARQAAELERQSADEARQTAENASMAKNEFLSNMSHDIRTPMNGIMGMTSIAINNLDNIPQVRSCLKRISVSSRHLLGLINDMLDMAKIEGGGLALNYEPLSLRDMMQNIMTVIQPQIQENGQQFFIYVRDVRCENVCTDRVRLSQILLNIIGNSVKFTPKGGVIEVSLSEEPSPKGDKYIRSRLHVKDNGIGMAAGFKKKIFDAFAREDNARVEKAAGAGMGLTITKKIVDAMEGEIWVESEQGKGTVFYVTLDLEKAAVQEPEFVLPQLDVLAVDDDSMAGSLAVSALESIGLQADWAPDMEQAVSMIEKRLKQGKSYDAALLDWNLPRQGGIQAAKSLKEQFGSSLPILLFSDGDWGELEYEAEEAGVCGFLSKPLFRSGLFYTLRPFAESKMVQKQDLDAGDKEGTEEAGFAKDEGEDGSLAGKRILVAEDNELNWEIADAMLSEMDMVLEWAENGQACLEKFQQSQIGWYDAILMDLRMPVMTGFEAARAIRGLAREDALKIPIIAVSADAFEEDVKKCMESGMNAHTAKPLDLCEVLSLLEECIK